MVRSLSVCFTPRSTCLKKFCLVCLHISVRQNCRSLSRAYALCILFGSCIRGLMGHSTTGNSILLLSSSASTEIWGWCETSPRFGALNTKGNAPPRSYSFSSVNFLRKWCHCGMIHSHYSSNSANPLQLSLRRSRFCLVRKTYKNSGVDAKHGKLDCLLLWALLWAIVSLLYRGKLVGMSSAHGDGTSQ